MEENKNYYNELLELAIDTEQNLVWVRNKIYLYEKEDYISYREREELLGKLADRYRIGKFSRSELLHICNSSSRKDGKK